MKNDEYNEQEFWQLIENVWELFEEPNQIRRKIIEQGGTPELLKKASNALNQVIVPVIEEKLRSFTKDNLIAFDQVLEKKLYDIDREDVQEYIEGGDDGFLYKRGFVVGMGQDYYNQINKNPIIATGNNFSWHLTGGISCEAMCLIALAIHLEQYNEAMPITDISRESGINKAGWPDGF